MFKQGNKPCDSKKDTAHNVKNGGGRFKINFHRSDICPLSDKCPCGYDGMVNVTPNCGHIGFRLFFCIDPYVLRLLIMIEIGRAHV